MKSLSRLLGGAVAAIALGIVTLSGTHGASAISPAQQSTGGTQADQPKGYYLALGDSLAFGYQDARFKSAVAAGTYNAASFNTGYVDGFLGKLKTISPLLQLVNYACPGETSSSFVSGGCAFHQQVPLHSDYPASQSQLAAAVGFLQSHPGNVNPITLNIGGNDLGNLFFETCNQDLSCAQRQVDVVIGKAATNLNQILTSIQTAAPSSEIILLSQYDPYVVAIPESVPAFQSLNSGLGTVARAHGVRIADGSSAFTATSLCSLTLFCVAEHPDIHPSDAGYQALAQAVWSASSFGSVAAAQTPGPIGGLAVAVTGSDSATCGAVTSPCKTITQALANAGAGVTITVQAGTYKETVTVSKQVVLQGQQATIDATGLVNGILIKASGSTVSGFTVRNAQGEGILAMSVSNVTISNNIVLSNDKGAHTSVTTECQDAGSVPGDCGEGLHLMSVANSTVSNNDVEQNVGGLLVTDELGPTHDNVISSNTVSNNLEDCGITLASHNAQAVSATGQRQPDKGGVYNNRVDGNTVASNGDGGVGIFAPFPGASAYSNTVSNNVISGNGMPGIAVHAHAPNQDMNGNTFTNNKIDRNNVVGDTDAGDMQTTGILLSSVVGPITGTTISGNQISNNTFGIWVTANVSTAGFASNTFTNVGTQLQVQQPSPPPSTPTTPPSAPAPPNTGDSVGIRTSSSLGFELVVIGGLALVAGAAGIVATFAKARRSRSRSLPV